MSGLYKWIAANKHEKLDQCWVMVGWGDRKNSVKSMKTLNKLHLSSSNL
jgi:hypothetical protein